MRCYGAAAQLATGIWSLIPANSDEHMADFLYNLVREAARYAPVWPGIFGSPSVADKAMGELAVDA